MFIFVQFQAAIIARKKEVAADNLREARDELQKVEAEANEKRSQVKDQDGGGEVLKGEEVYIPSYTNVTVVDSVVILSEYCFKIKKPPVISVFTTQFI